ncbi:hypothetical protein QOT17_001885 [Balamuthia mandrillaris]
MGAVPSVSLKYTFPGGSGLDPVDLYENLKRGATELPGWKLTSFDDEVLGFDAIVQSGCCGALCYCCCGGGTDKVDVTVERSDENILVVAVSRTQGAWARVWSGCVSDGGRQAMQLRDLLGTLHMPGQYTEEVVFSAGGAVLPEDEVSLLLPRQPNHRPDYFSEGGGALRGSGYAFEENAPLSVNR